MSLASGSLTDIKGAKVKAAFSSLTEFSCEFDNGKGVILRAEETASGPAISASVVSSDEIPRSDDAVCKVDWSWICDSAVQEMIVAAAGVRFSFFPAGPLAVTVQMWQGKPFLAFQPFRPAAK